MVPEVPWIRLQPDNVRPWVTMDACGCKDISFTINGVSLRESQKIAEKGEKPSLVIYT